MSGGVSWRIWEAYAHKLCPRANYMWHDAIGPYNEEHVEVGVGP